MYAKVQKGVIGITAEFGDFKSAIPKRRYSEDSPVQCSTVTPTLNIIGIVLTFGIAALKSY